MSFADFIQGPEPQTPVEIHDPVTVFVTDIEARGSIEGLSQFEILGAVLEQVEYGLLTNDQAMEACKRLDLQVDKSN